MPIKINGATSGSTTIAAPDTGSDETIVLSTALASKLDTTAYTAPGLVLVASETFSAVSSVSVNGCFTSTYQNYLMTFFLDHSTDAASQLRLRVSGSDNTSSVYDAAGLFNNGSTPLATESQNATAWNLDTTTGLRTRFGFLQILRPHSLAATFVTGVSNQTSGSALRAFPYGAVHTDATSFDGFSVLASTGTITGTVRVYGYKD